MTKENKNSISSGSSTPEKTSAKPKKAAPRKTSAKKATEPEVAAKAKPAAKKAEKPKTPASTEKPSGKAEKPKASSPKAATKAAPKKTAVQKAAPKAETAKTSVTKAVTPKNTSAKKTAEKKPAAQKTARPSTAKKSTAKAKAEPENSVEAVKTPDGAAKKPAPKPKAPRKPKAAEAPKSAPASEEKKVETPPAEEPKAVDTESAEQPRSSSRRSRRGGRRRNKKAAQPTAEETAAKAEHEAEADDDAGIEQPEELKEKSAKAKPEQNKAQKGKKTEDKPAKDSGAKIAAPDKASSKKAEPEPQPAKASSGKRKMFISVLSGELVEVVLAEEAQVQEYYVEMQHQAKVKGNIYKGVVSNIDANLQAAFVSYAGGVKNGFLQIDEVHPEYYVADHDPAKGRKYPPIQKVLKPGQEILVQVVKEPAGTKGAFLTSYLSLPGRFLVLTPGREQIGVSRKVENDAERARLRTILDGLPLGDGLGVIVRTVSSDASKTSLSRDLQFLKRLWKEVRAKGQTQPSPSLIYEELDLSTRAIRDYLTDDVQEVWVDDEETAKQVTELASLLFPKKRNLVQVHHDAGHSLFERFSLQKQLDQIHSREVSLPSGGRLVIDNTEALTAIDINSGRSSGKSNFEDMAFRTNLEAAKAIPSHLRLRDIGGQVVIDFIEMRDRDHWREVEKAVRNGMKGDRARYDVGKIGPFGLLEIVRQRLGSSAISVSTEPCPCCKGTGIRRNMEWQAMQSLRDINRALRQAAANNQTSLSYPTEGELAFYLLNAKRSILLKMEEESGVTLVIRPSGE